MTVGAGDPATLATKRALEERSGVALEWVQDQVNPLPAVRVAGIEPDHGIAIVLSQRNFAVAAELAPERFAGGLLRMIGDNVTGDREMWRGLFDESRARGQDLSLYVNNEPCTEVDDLPSGAWRNLEFEASARLAKFGGEVDSALQDVMTTCLSLILAGIDPNPSDAPDEDTLGNLEGTARRVVATRYERNRANRLRCIRHFGPVCWACDFDFKEFYGPSGDGLIVVHHVIPVSQLGPDYRLNPLRDLVPVCDNCHRVVHTEDPPIPPEQLRASLGKPPKPPRG